MSARGDFRQRYGPWALVAGASEGLGAAFAEAAAARGLDVVLLARRAEALRQVADGLGQRHGVRTHCEALDLRADDLQARLTQLASEREIGLGIYNAALSLPGPFLQRPLADALGALELNARGPLVLAHTLGSAMQARGRGGLVLVSSLASLQGTPLLSTYAATKAFERILAEGLWRELGPVGLDVVACLAGATDTPNLHRSRPAKMPSAQAAAEVAEQTLDGLGRGPLVVPGRLNRLAAQLMTRVLSRKRAIRILEDATRSMYGGAPE